VAEISSEDREPNFEGCAGNNHVRKGELLALELKLGIHHAQTKCYGNRDGINLCHFHEIVEELLARLALCGG
jgi:hypothetical protein